MLLSFENFHRQVAIFFVYLLRKLLSFIYMQDPFRIFFSLLIGDFTQIKKRFIHVLNFQISSLVFCPIWTLQTVNRATWCTNKSVLIFLSHMQCDRPRVQYKQTIIGSIIASFSELSHTTPYNISRPGGASSNQTAHGRMLQPKTSVAQPKHVYHLYFAKM